MSQLEGLLERIAVALEKQTLQQTETISLHKQILAVSIESHDWHRAWCERQEEARTVVTEVTPDGVAGGLSFAEALRSVHDQVAADLAAAEGEARK